MIALLAAVPEETRLIRQSSYNLECREQHGLKFWLGNCCGVPICLTHSGIGKAAAAATATTLLLNYKPQSLWLFGCGGAYSSSGLDIGDLALANLEIFGDEGVTTAQGFLSLAEMGLAMRKGQSSPLFNAWPVDSALTDWAESQLKLYCSQQKLGFTTGAFVTVSSCTGTSEEALDRVSHFDGVCENMEGAAVALASHQLGTPFLELRGISNRVEARDTRHWDLEAGMNTAQKAILALLMAQEGVPK